ncbi:MAG: acetyl-CoA carboxylase, carboxyltransferase subunit beta [Pyrinomonadaceae bacterium]
MSWFRRDKPKIEDQDLDEERKVKTEGIFVKCPECENSLYKRELIESFHVCPHCDYHFRFAARERLDSLFDEGEYEQLDEDITSGDPLEFFDTKPYKDRLVQARETSGLPEAIVSGVGKVGGHLVYAGAMDMSFIGGSMGSAVGEKITLLIERALEKRGAVIIFSASGGARMQEGTLSLMQMGKISAALSMLHAARLPFISVLTDPTTGGVTASFAMLGDVIMAEPKALIGFAGPRVIEQTIRQKLPKGFQRSEFLLEHGMVDLVIDRRKLRETIIRSLNFMMNESVVAQG